MTTLLEVANRHGQLCATYLDPDRRWKHAEMNIRFRRINDQLRKGRLTITLEQAYLALCR